MNFYDYLGMDPEQPAEPAEDPDPWVWLGNSYQGDDGTIRRDIDLRNGDSGTLVYDGISQSVSFDGFYGGTALHSEFLAEIVNYSELYDYMNEFERENEIYDFYPGSAEIFIWDYRGSDEAWGHASMKLEDGTYISFWPGGDPNKPGPIYEAEEIRNRTYENDVRDEGQQPAQVIKIKYVNVPAVRKWWGKWQKENNWKTFSCNCSTTVAKGLMAGGMPKQFEFFWTPNDVDDYVKNIADEQAN